MSERREAAKEQPRAVHGLAIAHFNSAKAAKTLKKLDLAIDHYLSAIESLAAIANITPKDSVADAKTKLVALNHISPELRIICSETDAVLAE